MNNINELIERAHSQAKSMGWWDQERNTGELLMLIVSECGEALEAHRSGKRARWADFERDLNDPAIARAQAMRHEEDPRIPRSSPFEYSFRTSIKDTFEDELADIVIRIADYLGHIDYTPLQNEVKSVNRAPLNVGEALFAITKTVAIEIDICLEWAIHGVFATAGDHDIDLWRHIDLKLKYNLTRGKKHGKAY